MSDDVAPCGLCGASAPRVRGGLIRGLCEPCDVKLTALADRGRGGTPVAAYLLHVVEEAWDGRLMLDQLRALVRVVANYAAAFAPPRSEVERAATRLLLSQPALPFAVQDHPGEDRALDYGRLCEREPRRYRLPSTKDDSWSVVFIDGGGTLSIVSDYGNWGHFWSPSGWKTERTPDFRQFLCGMGADYLARKIGSSAELNEHDPDATGRNVRRQILSHRRRGALSRAAARREWDSLPAAPDALEFHDWYCETELSDAYELVQTRRSFGLEHWTRVSFERLREMLRAELEASGLGEPAVP